MFAGPGSYLGRVIFVFCIEERKGYVVIEILSDHPKVPQPPSSLVIDTLHCLKHTALSTR